MVDDVGAGANRDTASKAERALAYLRRHALEILVVLVPSCTAGSYVSDELLDSRLPRGLRVLEVDVSHLETSRARELLAASAGKRLAQPISLEIEGKSVELLPADAGLSIDVDRTLTQAVAARRSNGALLRLGSWLSSWVGRATTSSPVVIVDADRFARRLDEIEKSLLSAPFAGGFHLEKGRIVAEYPRAGRVLDRRDAKQRIETALADGRRTSQIRVHEVAAPFEAAIIDRLVERARRMSSGDVILTASAERRLTLGAAELARALRVAAAPGSEPTLSFDGEALLTGLGERRAQIEIPARSARFVVHPDDRVELIPSQVEERLEASSLAQAVERAAASPERGAELPLVRGAEPELSTEQAQALSIRGRVSSFTTRHPCCERRVDNIHRIADLLDGLIVKPGETISVNAVVGPRTTKNGFVSAPTIEEGEMVDTIGGGISQFATTFFNALFYGGYDIIERQPHTYWFPRYPMGHEATLSFPKPDLVFRNDTDAGMLIHTSYTKTTITVSIYGDNGGRRVTAEVSQRQNIVEPPIEILPNPAVSPEKEHTLQGGMIGWSVIVGRVIRFPDGTKKEERRKVTYKPKTRRVEVHPCRVPEGEKGYTGERCPEPEDSGEET
ncbi:MAG: VanW family protein [Myxococcota bacterium]